MIDIFIYPPKLLEHKGSNGVGL